MKLFVNVLVTAAVATLSGSIVGLRERRERRRVEKEAQEALVSAWDELRAVRKESLNLSAKKDKEVEAAEKTIHFLADLLGALESDVQSVVVETQALRRKAEEVQRCSEARTAVAEGVSGRSGVHEQPQAVEYAAGRKAHEKPGGVEEGLDLTLEERFSPRSNNTSEGSLQRRPTAALEVESRVCGAATSDRRDPESALEPVDSHSHRAYRGRGARRGRGLGGRGGYRRAHGAERGKGRRGGRSEGARGGHGRGSGGSRGSRRSERGALRGSRV